MHQSLWCLSRIVTVVEAMVQLRECRWRSHAQQLSSSQQRLDAEFTRYSIRTTDIPQTLHPSLHFLAQKYEPMQMRSVRQSPANQEEECTIRARCTEMCFLLEESRRVPEKVEEQDWKQESGRNQMPVASAAEHMHDKVVETMPEQADGCASNALW
ncbi:hypothetical protein BGW80DRAFT_1253114 [Lactifluus volemus]|nr:hypothetical protein BGW80DRAFT_1253114 [Lactifluus volemus]